PVAVADRRLQLVETVAAPGVGGNVGQPRDEAVELLLVDLLGRDMLADRLAGITAIVLVGQLGARGADDARRLGELPRLLPIIEGRQQFALGEVAGAAEDDEIEWLDGNDLAGYLCPLLGPRCAARSIQIDLGPPVPGFKC